jgi:hypothetical protein
VTDTTGGELGRWRTFGDRVIYESPWVWLGQVDVEIPGDERFWHHIVRLHRAAFLPNQPATSPCLSGIILEPEVPAGGVLVFRLAGKPGLCLLEGLDGQHCDGQYQEHRADPQWR